jgi:cytochrome c-type biogenesis protein CcmE
MPTRFVIGAGLILGAIAVISMVTYFSNQEAYFTVDELLARTAPSAGVAGPVVAAAEAAAGTGSAALDGRRLQVRGTVDDASVRRASDGLEMRFRLTDKSGAVAVVYHGLVPDTFDLAEEVTVGGRLAADGTLLADQLFVQCPSKYEVVPPGQAGDGRGARDG